MSGSRYIKVSASTDDLLFMFGSALRYGLGRRSYSTSLISGVIANNLPIINQKWLINFLRDIIEYEERRARWEYKTCSYDNICNYENWTNLKAKLIAEYNKRNYEESLDYYYIKATEIRLYFISNKKRNYLGSYETFNDVSSKMLEVSHEMWGVNEITYRSSLEIDSLIKYDIGRDTDYFEVELDAILDGKLSKLFGRRLPYRGVEYLIGGVSGKKSFFDNAFCFPVNYTTEQIRAACIKIYKSLAKKDLTTKVNKFALLMGVIEPPIKINGAISRLSNYSEKNSLNLSWRLVMCTDELSDYAIVCALAQIIDRKKSQRYQEVINSIIPDNMITKEKFLIWHKGLSKDIL